MQVAELEKEILEILEDSNISVEEKQDLRELAASVSSDKLRFMRNKAFDIARQEVARSPSVAQHTFKWLEKMLKAIDVTIESSTTVISSAHFSPGESCRNKLLYLMKTARKQIDICVFTISDNRLTEEILTAHRRGIRVRIITDNDKSLDRGSDIYQLVDQGLKLRMDKTPYHMHHKFMVVDSMILVSGSFNWTRSATEKNHENILVSGDTLLVKDFQEKFEELWKLFR